MTKVMSEYSNHGNALPAVAMKFVENTLLPQADKLAQETKPNIDKWGKVAQHYQPKQTEATADNKGELVNNSDDDLTYDV